MGLPAVLWRDHCTNTYRSPYSTCNYATKSLICFLQYTGGKGRQACGQACGHRRTRWCEHQQQSRSQQQPDTGKQLTDVRVLACPAVVECMALAVYHALGSSSPCLSYPSWCWIWLNVLMRLCCAGSAHTPFHRESTATQCPHLPTTGWSTAPAGKGARPAKLHTTAGNSTAGWQCQQFSTHAATRASTAAAAGITRAVAGAAAAAKPASQCAGATCEESGVQHGWTGKWCSSRRQAGTKLHWRFPSQAGATAAGGAVSGVYLLGRALPTQPLPAQSQP